MVNPHSSLLTMRRWRPQGFQTLVLAVAAVALGAGKLGGQERVDHSLAARGTMAAMACHGLGQAMHLIVDGGSLMANCGLFSWLRGA